MLFVFAAVLLYSAWKLLKDEDDELRPRQQPGRPPAASKVVPVRDEYAGTKFFVKEAGKRVATPLLAVVVAIEAADLVFAVDSVPAVLAVSDDPFIVYSSNAFAILGLRALYFLLAGLLERFHLLSKGLAVILAFIGVKLVLQAGAQGDQHLDPRDPVAGQPGRHRRRAHRERRAQPAAAPADADDDDEAAVLTRWLSPGAPVPGAGGRARTSCRWCTGSCTK